MASENTTAEDEIVQLRKELESVREEAAKKRISNRDLKDENDRLRADLDTTTKERNELNSKVGKPSELQERIDALLKENRTLKHRGVFEKAATTAGVKSNPKALDTLWAATGLAADTDEVDDQAISAAIESAKESHDFLFDPPAESVETTKPQVRPGLGGDRGGASPRAFAVTGTQMRDPRFVYENREAIAANTKTGTIRYHFDR